MPPVPTLRLPLSGNQGQACDALSIRRREVSLINLSSEHTPSPPKPSPCRLRLSLTYVRTLRPHRITLQQSCLLSTFLTFYTHCVRPLIWKSTHIFRRKSLVSFYQARFQIQIKMPLVHSANLYSFRKS